MAPFQSDLVETSYADGGTARFAYRRMGPPGGTPLVLNMRLRGTIDHWDPLFLDVLSQEREVFVFDNRGTGSSTGTPADTIDGMADGLLEFVDTLGLSEIDLLGWSMGGYVAQTATLSRPLLVRRLVVAGSGPGRIPDLPPAAPKVWEVVGHEVNDDEDFLYLFFPENVRAQRAGLASLRRLDTRLRASGAVVAPEAVAAQLAALGSMGSSIWDRLAQLALPVLVGTGTHDVMINSYASFAMTERLPHAKVVLYSDAGHAFLFQHAEDFGREIVDFLR